MKLKTRKSSCVTTRGIPPAAYPVCGMCSPGVGGGRRYPCPSPGRGGGGHYCSGPGWVKGYFCPGPGWSKRGYLPSPRKGPGTRDWRLDQRSGSTPWERTVDQRPGVPLPCERTWEQRTGSTLWERTVGPEARGTPFPGKGPGNRGQGAPPGKGLWNQRLGAPPFLGKDLVPEARGYLFPQEKT